jgi:PAS domain S-box-containing protein
LIVKQRSDLNNKSGGVKTLQIQPRDGAGLSDAEPETGERPELLSEESSPEDPDPVTTERYECQSRVFDATLSAITDFVYIIDRDGRFLYANQALLNLWGLTLEAAVGKNFFDLKYPDDLAAKLHRQIQQVVASREVLSDETTYTSPTGAGGHYEYIFSPVVAADGRVEAVAGSTRDITERKRTGVNRGEAGCGSGEPKQGPISRGAQPRTAFASHAGTSRLSRAGARFRPAAGGARTPRDDQTQYRTGNQAD